MADKDYYKITRATLSRLDTGEMIEFLTNPHGMDEEKGAQYDDEEVSGAVAPTPKFKNGGAKLVKFSIRFIAKGQKALDQKLFLDKLVIPTGPKKIPPKVYFCMGKVNYYLHFRDLKTTYATFNPSLMPVDFTIDVSASVVYDAPGNTGSGSNFSLKDIDLPKEMEKTRTEPKVVAQKPKYPGATLTAG
jgi:hypothetical protein